METAERAAVQVAAQVAGIAAAPGSIEQRAAALLGPMRRVVPFQAARIGLLDPERRELVLLADRGYDDPARAYLTSPAAVAEIERVGLHRIGPPLRLRDFPVPPAELRAWAEYLWPAGFREVFAVGLFAPDGRLLAVHAEQSQQAGWAAFDAGWHDLAKEHYRRSHAAATEAGDPGLAGNALAFHAYQLIALNRPARAISEKSVQAAEQAGVDPGVRALLYSRAAWTFALDGDAATTARCLGLAEEAHGPRAG